MIHLKPSDETKVIEIISRKFELGLIWDEDDILWENHFVTWESVDLRVNIRDEQTNETISYDELQYIYQPTTQYLKISGGIDLIEGHTYEFELVSITTGNVFHRNKIFATNQTIDQSQNEDYSINDGKYTEHSNENEFIIL